MILWTLAAVYQSALCNIPEDLDLQWHHCEKLKS